MRKFWVITTLSVFALSCLGSAAWAQDRDRERAPDRYYDREHQRYTRLLPGTTITVRPNESIDAETKDNRIYTGVVDQDVRGDNGQVAVPRGSTVELIVRVERDNDLILDLESVIARGQRYDVQTDATRVESSRDNSLVGAIVSAINGGEVRGRAVRIPRNTLLTFRVDARSISAYPTVASIATAGTITITTAITIGSRSWGRHHRGPFPCSAAFNANPRATDVNSFPERVFSAPKRRSKILRTAGKKDEPPVRNTLSTSPPEMPEDCTRESTHASIWLRWSPIHSSNTLR